MICIDEKGTHEQGNLQQKYSYMDTACEARVCEQYVASEKSKNILFRTFLNKT